MTEFANESVPLLEDGVVNHAEVDSAPQLGESSAFSEEKTILKLNRRIATIGCAIIFFSYMDRGNLGLAANDLCDDLKLSHTEYGIGVGVFHIGYVLSQTLSNILLVKFGAPIWLSTILGAWGIIAGCFAFMQSPVDFYILRILLGVAEGGTFPGVWYYMTLFYPDRYLVKPFGYSVFAIYVSIPVSVPIAAGLLQLDGFLGVAGWRHLFFIEGVMPLLFTLVVFFGLSRSPERSSFLTNEEKSWLVAEKGAEQEQKSKEISFGKQLKTVFSSKAFLFVTTGIALFSTVFVSLCYWMTLIINDMLDGDEDDDEDETCGSSGKHETLAVILTAVPHIFAAFCAIVCGSTMVSNQNQVKLVAIALFVGGVDLAFWMLANKIGFVLGYFCLILATGVSSISYTFTTSFGATIFDQSVRSTALALMNSIAMVGSIIFPPLLGMVVDSYGYSAGMPILSALYLLASFSTYLATRTEYPTPSFNRP